MAEPANVQTQGTQNQYSDPLDRFWNLYLLDADKEGGRMAERWKGDADGILIFTGLFATTVGSFIIATYPNLQQNSTDQSVEVLLVMAQQLGQIKQLLASPGSPVPQSPLNITALETFAASPAAIKVNILWIFSFFLSLFCALLATLVQQWSRTYIGDTQKRGTPRTRGAIHSFLRVGVERFGFNHAVDAIITLLHISVLLFTAGFLVFMLDINDLVARTLLGAVIGASILYLVMTVLPIIFPDCPYSTPLTLAVQILARYPSLVASRIIARQLPAHTSNYETFRRWYRWYNSFKRLSLPGRQYTFTLCRNERSYQRPVHVLNQMIASVDESDEIFEFVTSLPHYLKSLDKIGYDFSGQPWSQFSYLENLYPLMQSFDTYYDPSLVLTPRKTDQLVRLVLLANAAGVQHNDPNVIFSPENRWMNTPSGMRVCSHLITDNSAWWRFKTLSNSQNPVVSFLSRCLLSSVYVVEHYNWEDTRPGERKTLEDVTLFDGYTGIVTKDYELHRDKLLSSLALCGHDLINIYRLLFFIRVILHYSTLPESPVATYEHIWLPVLEGLCNLTMQLDFKRISHDAGVTIWRVFSVIGRDDLVPISAPGSRHQYRGRKLDYTNTFKKYPIVADTLKKLANATIGRRDDVQIRRRASTPVLVQMHDGHTLARESRRERLGSRQRRYSFPMRHNSAIALPKPGNPQFWDPYSRLESPHQDNPTPVLVQNAKNGAISSRLGRLIQWSKRKKLRDEEANRSSGLSQ